MQSTTQILYGSCWVILALYMLTTILVFTQRSCTSYAASFLFACALWVDLTLFNFWFLLPAFFRHLYEFEGLIAGTGGEGGGGGLGHAARSVATSPALEDLALMLIGWLASAMSISNSFDVWQRMELYLDTEPHRHHHGPVAGRIIGLARRMDGYVGIEQTGRLRLPDARGDEPRRRSARTGAIFAVPRWAHKYMMVFLSNDFFAENGLITLEDKKERQVCG